MNQKKSGSKVGKKPKQTLSHPNCITFSDAGRMFVGSSTGQILIWDISLTMGQISAANKFKIDHKELEGD